MTLKDMVTGLLQRGHKGSPWSSLLFVIHTRAFVKHHHHPEALKRWPYKSAEYNQFIVNGYLIKRIHLHNQEQRNIATVSSTWSQLIYQKLSLLDNIQFWGFFFVFSLVSYNLPTSICVTMNMCNYVFLLLGLTLLYVLLLWPFSVMDSNDRV